MAPIMTYEAKLGSYDHDDYAVINFNATGGVEVRYIVGGGTTPSFEAKCVLLIPTVDCLIRFENHLTRIGQSQQSQHLIQLLYVPYTLFREFTALHIIGNTVAGILYAHILG